MDQNNNNIQKRKWKQISEKERYTIEALYEQGLKAKQIGECLSPRRDRRTIERELQLSNRMVLGNRCLINRVAHTVIPNSILFWRKAI